MDRDVDKARRRFGARVKQLRESHRMTQYELAERCDVSQRFISQLERGANTPSFETIISLAHRGFGVAVADLVRAIDPQQNPGTDIERMLAEASPKIRIAAARILKILLESAE